MNTVLSEQHGTLIYFVIFFVDKVGTIQSHELSQPTVQFHFLLPTLTTIQNGKKDKSSTDDLKALIETYLTELRSPDGYI